MNEISARVYQEFDYRIALQAKDKFEYNDILGLRNGFNLPERAGRGLCNIGGVSLEYHVAVPNCQEDAQKQALAMREVLAARTVDLERCKPAKQLPVMQSDLEYADFCNHFEPDRIPLGFSMASMQEIAMPLQQLFTMSLYFGNPVGIKPVLFNLISGFRKENADVIIMRRNTGTIFDRRTEESLSAAFGNHCNVGPTNEETVEKLFKLLIEDYIPQYIVPHRNEYCEKHGIPETDKGRTLKAAKYIRSKTKPLFILFESFTDLVAADKGSLFADIFAMLKGFNIYFAAGFYPEDESKAIHSTFRNFNKEDFSLYFGGQFHKQWITSLPNEFRSMEKINPNYNRYVMRYRNAFHRMVMPCGELIAANADPDEAEII